MLEKYIEMAAENAVPDAADYVNEDGLLVCGKCHTPKQVRVVFMGVETTPYCMCKCESAAYEQERAALHAMQNAQFIERMRKDAFSDLRFQFCTFSADDGANPEFTETAKRYAANFECIREQNCGLMLYGEPGTGKSFYAACIVNALIDRGISAYMTNVTDITRVNEPAVRDAMLERLSGCDLVVIDDIGSERGTDYALEQLYAAIDRRYRSGKPLIVTTNYDPKQLMAVPEIGRRRIYDRIQENCTPIVLKGVRRKSAGLDKTKILTKILYSPQN